MCEVAKSQRRTYRDQDPPRIIETTSTSRSAGEPEASGDGETKRNADPDFFRKQQRREESASITGAKAALQRDSTGSPGRDNTSVGSAAETSDENNVGDHTQETAALAKVPSPSSTPRENSKEQVRYSCIS